MIGILALNLLLAGPVQSGVSQCSTSEQPKAWVTTCELGNRTWIDAFGDYENFGFARSMSGDWQPLAEPGLLFVDEIDGDVARMVTGTDTVFVMPSRLLPKAAHEGSWVKINVELKP